MMENLTTKQKLTAAGLVIFLIIIIWLIKDTFSSGSAPTPPPPTAAKPGAMQANAPGAGTPGAPVQPAAPQAVSLQPKTAPQYSEREIALIRLQQETQAKYIAAVNELQMLRIEKDIAETNKDIAKAELDAVTAKKGVVDLLTKPAAPAVPSEAYAQGLINPTVAGMQNMVPPAPTTTPTTTTPPQTTPTETSYVVLSVSYLMNRWNAVIGSQGKLYTVAEGDVLPPDGSVVIRIDRSGVELEKNGVTKKVSLVAAI